MDHATIRTNATKWMIDRCWKRKTAKRGAFNQSLFEHTIYELDALFTLWPIISQSWRLDEEDFNSLIVGSVAHDVGKETPNWQQYVLSPKGAVHYTPHVIEDLTQAAVDELFEKLGVKGSWDNSKAFVRYHMQATKTADSLMFDAINKGDKTNRWMTLSTIVAEIDNICSASGLLNAMVAIERSNIGKHIRVSYHLVQMRGVSTTLLHRSALEAFQNQRWLPLLHYSNGTIYAAALDSSILVPAQSEIIDCLAANIEKVMGTDFASAIVATDFTSSAISMPPLYDYKEIKDYLQVAGTRVKGGDNRFAKKLQSSSGRSEVEKNVKSYLEFLEDTTRIASEEEILVRESQRMSRAYPEICIFKFFKAAMDPELIGDTLTEEAQNYYNLLIPTSNRKKGVQLTPNMVTQYEYDAVFGEGAFSKLRKTSTLMPAKDMAFSVDPYWSLPGANFGLQIELVEFAPDSTRCDMLVSTLTGIAERVYLAIPSENRPIRTNSYEIANEFMVDLIHPSFEYEWPAIAAEQLQVYEQSKLAAKSSKGDHFCPICNQKFGSGSVAKAAYLDKPDSHTNRAVSHGSHGYIVICSACKYERFIQNLLLGGKPSELLILVPRMNIGQGSGTELVKKANDLYHHALVLMSNDTTDPNEHVSLSLTSMIARKLEIADVFDLSPQQLLDLFTYSASKDKRKEYRKTLEERLRKEIGDTVDSLNNEWDTQFQNWAEAVQALIDGKVIDDFALSIRAEAFKLQPSLRIVCQTPHLILIPLLYGMKGDKESEVNAAIRRLFAMLLLGLALDCSVAILDNANTITFEGGEGVVQVPSVPALRELVGEEWIGLDQADKWLKAIGAASLLAPASNFPESSNLYQILSAPTVGHILRRIEQKSDSGMASYTHLQYLESLKEFLK